MTIQEFGNAFKAVISNVGKRKDKRDINDNRIADFYDDGYDYAENDSAIIDNHYNDLNILRALAMMGRGNADDLYTITDDEQDGIPGVPELNDIIEDWRAPILGTNDDTDVAGRGGNPDAQGRISDAI